MSWTTRLTFTLKHSFNFKPQIINSCRKSLSPSPGPLETIRPYHLFTKGYSQKSKNMSSSPKRVPASGSHDQSTKEGNNGEKSEGKRPREKIKSSKKRVGPVGRSLLQQSSEGNDAEKSESKVSQEKMSSSPKKVPVGRSQDQSSGEGNDAEKSERKVSQEKMSSSTKKVPVGRSQDQSSGEGNDAETSERKVTREYMIKHDRETFLNMEISKKRKNYFCGDKYLMLDDIPTWPSYAKHNKIRTSSNVLYEVDDDLNSKVSIWKGDITVLEIDAIANAANKSLLGGGGVDGCIHRAAGYKLKSECSTLNSCSTGDAKATAGYNLPAKYVIHTVGPIGHKPAQLKSCYKRCFEVMLENNIRSVAFPCISTGIYGYPNDDACHVALKTTRDWLSEDNNRDKIDRVIFCLFMKTDVEYYQQFMSTYFPLSAKENSDGETKEKVTE